MTSKIRDISTSSEFEEINIEKVRIKVLLEQSTPTYLSNLVVALTYTFLFRDKTGFYFLAIWMTFISVLVVGRIFFTRYFVSKYIRQERDFDPKKWEAAFTSLVLLSGLSWGVAISMVFHSEDLANSALLAFIIGGISSGAAVAYNTSLKATYSFFLPVVLPLTFLLAHAEGESSKAMAIMLVAYSFLFLKLTQKFNKYAVNSIILSFEKDKFIEKIRAMQARVTESAQMTALGQMARGMAHEINNPLAIILGASGAVRENFEKIAEGQEISEIVGRIPPLLRSIDNAANRVSRIVKELKFFAGRPDEEEYSEVPLRNVVTTAGNFCRERFKACDIDFVLDITDDLLIECRPFHLTQVILNLLNNSYDAICENSEKWIRVEAVDLGERVEVSVTDSGLGVSEEIRSKIMHPFFSTKDIGRGMGLGLSISKGIIDSHRGTLWLDQGYPNTRFTITLPKNKSVKIKEAS